MEGSSTLFRVLASRRFLIVALAGLVLTAVSAFNVQQGLTDRETIAAYPLSLGPYIALFGLNHLGSSLFTWFWILLVALHIAAVLFSGPSSTTEPFLRRSVSVPLAALAIPALAGLLLTGLVRQDTRVVDTTRLDVALADTPSGTSRQVVEEGASYQVPGPNGERTLTFGTVAQGPYALERTADGAIRAHIPIEGEQSVISVRSRRPLAISGPDGKKGAPVRGLDWILGLLAPLVALAIFIVAVRRAGGNQGGAEPWQSAVLLLSCVFLVANPLSGPGSSIFSLTSGNGSDALYLVRTITTGDVAAWTAELPVTAGLDFPRLLVWLGAGLAVVAVAALAASRSSAARLLTLASGGSILAAGIMDVLYAMGRIPVAASRADLMARFADSILPRIDMAESVLDFGVSGQGPFAISIMEGMAVGLALAVAGSVLIISSLRRMKGPKRPVEGLTAALAALTVFAGMRALVLSQTAVPHPPAAAPFAMIAMLIAAFAAFIALLHPKWKSGVLAVATIAAAMQLALA